MPPQIARGNMSPITCAGCWVTTTSTATRASSMRCGSTGTAVPSGPDGFALPFLLSPLQSLASSPKLAFLPRTSHSLLLVCSVFVGKGNYDESWHSSVCSAGPSESGRTVPSSAVCWLNLHEKRDEHLLGLQQLHSRIRRITTAGHDGRFLFSGHLPPTPPPHTHLDGIQGVESTMAWWVVCCYCMYIYAYIYTLRSLLS